MGEFRLSSHGDCYKFDISGDPLIKSISILSDVPYKVISEIRGSIEKKRDFNVYWTVDKSVRIETRADNLVDAFQIFLTRLADWYKQAEKNTDAKQHKQFLTWVD